MNCVKLEENCRYRMTCDKSQCTTSICQKTQDDISEGINLLIALQQPVDVLGNIDTDIPSNISQPKKKRK